MNAVLNVIAVSILVILILIPIMAISSLIFMLLWNWLFAGVLGLATFNFWQSLGMVVFIGLFIRPWQIKNN